MAKTVRLRLRHLGFVAWALLISFFAGWNYLWFLDPIISPAAWIKGGPPPVVTIHDGDPLPFTRTLCTSRKRGVDDVYGRTFHDVSAAERLAASEGRKLDQRDLDRAAVILGNRNGHIPQGERSDGWCRTYSLALPGGDTLGLSHVKFSQVSGNISPQPPSVGLIAQPGDLWYFAANPVAYPQNAVRQYLPLRAPDTYFRLLAPQD